MRHLSLLLTAIAAILLAIATHPSPTSAAPAPSPSPVGAPSPSPSPSPTPPPSTGQLNLSPATGAPGDLITVSGSRFRPAEAVTIFWDNRDHSLVGATADAQGSFSAQATAPDDPAGQHAVCALEPNQVCASFQLRAKVSPSSSPSPASSPAVASSAPTPYASTPLPQPAPTDSSGVSAISMLLQPPLILFPLLILLALVAASVFWIRAGSRRAAPRSMAAATISHRGQNQPAGPESGHPAFRPPPAFQPPPAGPGPADASPSPRVPAEPGDDPPDLPQAGD